MIIPVNTWLIDVLKVLPYLPKRDRTKGERWSVDEILRAHWASLWEDTNGEGAWERNDWVWALSFEKETA